MTIKKTFTLLCFFIFAFAHSQLPPMVPTFGEPLPEEFLMDSYAPDPEAPAVVLYERANNFLDVYDGKIMIAKEVHVKMKVFDAKRFENAMIEIPYYSEKNNSELIRNIKVVTHNGGVKTYLPENEIFNVDEYPRYSIKRFTFPNVKDGSILEYTYRKESYFFSNFGNWQFQSDLPKVYSELYTKIPGNMKYNRTLYGSKSLDINNAEIEKNCFTLPGYGKNADCEAATYGMKNVPAAKEENHMLAIENYTSGMGYELIEFLDFTGEKHTYSRNWDDVDNIFKYDKDLGRQLKFPGYFKDAIPSSIMNIPDKLEKAKAIYYYIQDHMAWDGKYRIFSDVRVKEAFERKSGNSSEINLALINALEAAGIDSKIMLIATREFRQPTMQYPVLSDFIYALVYLKMGQETYLLDATDKHTPFGVLPFRDLCPQGRVMDFKKGSFWEPVVPVNKNMHYVNMQLAPNEQGLFSGKVSEVSTGYIAVPKRTENNNRRKEDIIKRKQNQNEALDISNLQIENEKDLEQPYKENYDISINEQPVGNKLFVYPFLMQTYFSENPFSKETRKYPIDFGFPVINNYLVSIDVKDQYEIVKVPENKILKLPNNDGELSVVYDVSGSKVNVRLSAKLNTTSFPTEAYPALQQFFETLLKIQSKEIIELKKI
tara:strand:- start:1826 stop:3796 length:1971 start_codon:yes stop_codon:yes gene_type:complete